jgi:predicted nucleic acid-binding Zn finger protein
MRLQSQYLPSLAEISAPIFTAIATAAPLRSINDQQLISLRLLFGKTLDKALKILDNPGPEGPPVLCFTGQRSRRRLFVVRGKSKDDQYIVFPEHYCSCKAFQFDVVGRSDAPFCKHQLAARIADALGRSSCQDIDDYKLTNMLMAA